MSEGIRDCPECEQGKHVNCDTTAWDPNNDEVTVCPCHMRGHK